MTASDHDPFRACTRCNLEKTAAHFYKRPGTKTGLHSWCISCCKAAVAAATKKRRQDPNFRLKERVAKYGLTPEEYQDLEAAQGERCYVCLRREPLCVDHNHATGRVRGLLCKQCNSGLGMFVDSPWRLRRALLYFEISDAAAMEQEVKTNLALYALLATVDDVFTEEGAFSEEHIRKSLGRIYRQWKKTRAELDPDFNPEDYPKRARARKKRKDHRPTKDSPLLAGHRI